MRLKNTNGYFRALHNWKEKNCKEFHCNSSIIYLLIIFLSFSFYIGVYPGRLVRDTIGNISAAMDGVYSTVYPPYFEAIISLLIAIDNNIASLFLFQILLYWGGTLLLALYFYRSSIFYSFIVIIIAIFPYNIYLHNMIIKDVWLQGAYLLFFGSLCFYKNESINVNSLLMLVIAGISIILLRNNFVALIPAISISVSWFILKCEYSKKYLISFVILSISITLIIWISTSFIQSFLTEGRSNPGRNFNRLAAIDLIGISIQNNHEGVTSKLSNDTKKRINRVYNRVNIFWSGKVGIETVKLRNELINRKNVTELWINEIKNNPIAYINHRIHVIKKLFDGSGQSHTSMLKNEKVVGPRIYQYNLKNIDNESIKPTIVWKIYKFLVIKYFDYFRSQWWIIIVSILGSIWCLYIIIKTKYVSPDIIIFLLMNITSWSYFSPYFIMLGYSEVRYVYPSNSVILFSIPFLLSGALSHPFKFKY